MDFTVHLAASYLPARRCYWTTTLLALIPGNQLSSWTIHADQPAEPVASAVIDAFRRHGWPAIQAALDHPGYPPIA